MKTIKGIFIAAILLFSTVSFAQETTEPISYGTATTDANCCLVLDASSDLKEFYTADMSVFDFEDAAAAEKMMGYKSNNLVSLKSDFANNKMIIRIHNDRLPEPKDIIWWNEYLESICRR